MALRLGTSHSAKNLNHLSAVAALGWMQRIHHGQQVAAPGRNADNLALLHGRFQIERRRIAQILDHLLLIGQTVNDDSFRESVLLFEALLQLRKDTGGHAYTDANDIRFAGPFQQAGDRRLMNIQSLGNLLLPDSESVVHASDLRHQAYFILT